MSVKQQVQLFQSKLLETNNNDNENQRKNVSIKSGKVHRSATSNNRPSCSTLNKTVFLRSASLPRNFNISHFQKDKKSQDDIEPSNTFRRKWHATPNKDSTDECNLLASSSYINKLIDLFNSQNSLEPIKEAEQETKANHGFNDDQCSSHNTKVNSLKTGSTSPSLTEADSTGLDEHIYVNANIPQNFKYAKIKKMFESMTDTLSHSRTKSRRDVTSFDKGLQISKSNEDTNCSLPSTEHIYSNVYQNIQREVKLENELKENERINLKCKHSNYLDPKIQLFNDIMKNNQNSRLLWQKMPQVKPSLLFRLNASEIHLQEAKFEVLTSEASYYKSLVILDMHYALSRQLNDERILSKIQHKYLFKYTATVRKVSETILRSLITCYYEDVMMENMAKLLIDLANKHFHVYIKFCRIMPLINNTLKELKKNPEFTKALSELESSRDISKLHTLLIAPMQRFLRMIILVQAVLNYMSPDVAEYKTWEEALELFKKMAKMCDSECDGLNKIEKQYIELIEFTDKLHFAEHLPIKTPLLSNASVIRTDVFRVVATKCKIKFNLKINKIKLILLKDYLFFTNPETKNCTEVVMYYSVNNVNIARTCEVESKYCMFLLTIRKNFAAPDMWLLYSEEKDVWNEWISLLPSIDLEY